MWQILWLWVALKGTSKDCIQIPKTQQWDDWFLGSFDVKYLDVPTYFFLVIQNIWARRQLEMMRCGMSFVKVEYSKTFSLRLYPITWHLYMPVLSLAEKYPASSTLINDQIKGGYANVKFKLIFYRSPPWLWLILTAGIKELCQMITY